MLANVRWDLIRRLKVKSGKENIKIVTEFFAMAHQLLVGQGLFIDVSTNAQTHQTR